jgi:hypothetical protein
LLKHHDIPGKTTSWVLCYPSNAVSPLHAQSKDSGTIRMPWAMPLWHGFVQILQLAAKEHNDNNDDDKMVAMM